MDSGNQVCEALGFINGGDDVVMEINGDLLMSLMDESSLADDHREAESDDDQDRLNSLIRSFEAEIATGSNNKNMELLGHGDNDSESLDQSWTMTTGHVDDQDDEFGVEWVDMDFMPSSPSYHHDNSWCINDPYYDGVLVFENSLKEYEGYSMEEQNECNNNSFWQESYYNLVR